MSNEKSGLSGTIKTLIKFTLVGMVGAVVFMFFFGGSFTGQKKVVEFKEVAPESTSAMAEARKGGSVAVSYSKAVSTAAPSVVNIYTAKSVTDGKPKLLDDPFFNKFFGDEIPETPRKRLETSLGSGVIVSDQGYILTNNHVIEGADEIQVALRDGRTADVTVVGSDPESDLAVLKLVATGLPSITMGDSDDLQIGDVVLAIGNPFGVGQTVTMGIVSATGRDRLGLSTFENFIQTDAAINPGNSGGALVNAFGHLVGINTAIFSRTGGSQGIGFAIPISLAKDVTKQIIEHGRVVRGWLGVEIQDVTPELAESFNLSKPEGAIVAGVLKKGPADIAGLRPGDVITSVNGKAVADSKQTLKAISSAKPGDAVKLEFIRRGKNETLSAKAAERPQIQVQQQQPMNQR